MDDDLLELLELRESEAAPPARAIVCRCASVDEQEIEALLVRGATLDDLRARTGAGTSCSSCLPQLRRMFAGRG